MDSKDKAREIYLEMFNAISKPNDTRRLKILENAIERIKLQEFLKDEKLRKAYGEAERKAGYEAGIGTKCDKHNSGVWWCSACSFEDLEKQKKKARQAVLEEAAKVADTLHPRPNKTADELADRIRQLKEER